MPSQSRRTTPTPARGNTAGKAKAQVRNAVDSSSQIGEGAVGAGQQTGNGAVQLLRAPSTAVRTLVDDLAGAARRPDTVLTWAGLAGLAAFGVLEAPVAAAVGVGMAVAGARRRARD